MLECYKFLTLPQQKEHKKYPYSNWL